MSKKNENKTVSRVLEYISKARDLLETNDFKTILNHTGFFFNLENLIRVQVCQYINKEEHQLDFTYQDLQELSDEMANFLQKYPSKFLFSKHYKRVLEEAPIDNVKFKQLSEEIGYEMEVDTYLRSAQKTISYYAMVVMLWAETDAKLPFDVQLTRHIKSFLK